MPNFYIHFQGRSLERLAGGAALCVVNTSVSIGAIMLIQLNYAIAPRLWRRQY